MSMQKNLVDFLENYLVSPKVDRKEMEAKIEEIRLHLPTPVFWLLGKTQSGKTSVIRALTGSSRAEIGDGIRPCTKTAHLYEFPSAENCFIHFLDTRGLGETSYDPSEDMAVHSKRSHLLIVVMRAMDHAQQSVVEPLWSILREHPNWPVIVIQTSLHEGYPSRDFNHILPYPFFGDGTESGQGANAGGTDPRIPQDLARSLAAQRELFRGVAAQFVPVDFTRKDDGYSPADYGLDQLWSAIERALPLGLQAMVGNMDKVRSQLKGLYVKSAQPHIISYAVAAGSAGLIPVPMVGLPVTLAVQAKMFQTLASIYNQEFNPRRLAEFLGTMGLGALTSLGLRELAKFVPVLGTAAASLYNAATTYALGMTVCAYFSYALEGDLPDKEVFQALYKEQLNEGRAFLKDYLKGMRESAKEEQPPALLG